MKLQFKVFLLAVIVLSLPGVLLAEDYEYHPLLSDTFSVYLGAMKSSNSFKFESDALDDPGDYIDFDDSLHVSDDSTFLNGLVRWKFGSTKKWALAAQYFSNNEEGSSVLTDDIEWDGLTFLAGSTVDAGIKLKVARLFLGRSFYKSAQSDFGAGVGIHDLDISAYIEGVIFSDDETNISEKSEVGASQPLPNIGAWYFHSPAKKWLIHSRVDWISAEIGDYDGGLWNVSAGVNYQAFRHVGFDLSWQYFDLHVKVDKSSWRGKTKMTYSGPVLAVTFNW